MDIDTKLDRVVQRHAELRDSLNRPDLPRDDFTKASKEFSSLSEIVGAVETFRGVGAELADLQSLLEDPDTEPEMKVIAEDEVRVLKDRLGRLEHEIMVLLLPKDEADARSAILEIRAGTGGEEAALFGANLYRMYQRYAEGRGWKFEPISVSDTGIGGIKEAIVNVNGRDVFARLKFESGVHRVQRVPETENQGRVHTSAATVAVLPEAEEVDIQIDPKDLRIDVYRAQGAGGQHVNKTESAVRITHLPTNIVVTCQDDKSQHKNRATAMKVLRARLYEAQREQLDSERSASRKSQVGSGDRSERIRTYNFPQGRVTDHRINLTLYKLDRVMDGELDELIDALISDDQATRLAEAV